MLPNIKPQPAIATSTEGAFAWAFRKGSPELEAEVNAFVRTHREGTSFGNTVIRRYTGSTRFVASAAATAERKKFEAMVELFRRYADKYELDALLMMAQRYQESASRAGAGGVVGSGGDNWRDQRGGLRSDSSLCSEALYRRDRIPPRAVA